MWFQEYVTFWSNHVVSQHISFFSFASFYIQMKSLVNEIYTYLSNLNKTQVFSFWEVVGNLQINLRRKVMSQYKNALLSHKHRINYFWYSGFIEALKYLMNVTNNWYTRGCLIHRSSNSQKKVKCSFVSCKWEGRNPFLFLQQSDLKFFRIKFKNSPAGHKAHFQR